EIYNNGICADTALYATENGSATGVYGDAVTLSVNSNNNNMKFKAYGNKSRVIAFREYMGNDNFSIENGSYSGDWTGQTNCYPYRDEIGGKGITINASISSFGSSELYTNYAYNGNGNIEGESRYDIVSNDLGVYISKSFDDAGETCFKITQPADSSGTKRRFFAQLSPNSMAGEIPLNTMMMCSVIIRPNKEMWIRTNGKVSDGALMTEYKESDPFTTLTLPAYTWTRVDMAQTCVNNANTPSFNFAFNETSPTTDTEVMIKNIMILDRPDVVEYFNGAVSGGTWVDESRPYNCASTKMIEIGTPTDTNRAPMVSAGDDLTIYLPVTSVNLNGSVSDDGKPGEELIVQWSKVSGPGNVSFADPAKPITQCVFDSAGVYILNLTASDGELSKTDSVSITVANNTPISIKGITQKDNNAVSIEIDVIDTLSANARGIIAVYCSDESRLISASVSENIINAGHSGSGEFVFSAGLPFADEDIVKGFVWATDTNNKFTLYPLSTSVGYIGSKLKLTTTTYNAVEDSYIRFGGNTSKNYGTDTSIVVKNDNVDEYTRKGYIMFDLSGFSSGTVQNAKLRLYGKVKQESNLSVYSVNDNSWNESTINGSNAPEMGALQGNMTYDSTEKYVELDVTDYVLERISQDKKLTIGLQGEKKGGEIFTIYSRESSFKPELILSWN
ncbi:MAG: DNRLRE domain-containing protein, partial [Eubacteriales bacterium]|nr:DNRLRE domain-containing protein [Eubacteriales bacterium]